MLYDRNYMRNPLKSGFNSVVDKLIIVLLVSFVIQSLMKLGNLSDATLNYFSLSIDSLSNGYLWTLISYAFLHDSPLHLIGNLLGLHFIGRNVEILIGSQNFSWLCVLSAIAGGIIWIPFNNQPLIIDGRMIYPALLGASAIVMACLTYFCLLRPNQEISILLFFILPVNLRPKYILMAVLGIELYGFVFGELQNSNVIAHSAHLGGMLVGAAVYQFLLKNYSFPYFKLKFSSKEKFFKSKSQTKPSPKFSRKDFKVDISNYDQLQTEVNRILDKINDFGFGSLTTKEKDTLEKAKSLLHKN